MKCFVCLFVFFLEVLVEHTLFEYILLARKCKRE